MRTPKTSRFDELFAAHIAISKEEFVKLHKKALQEVRRNIERWLDEDKVFSDVTTSSLNIKGNGKMTIFSKNHEDFVIAGIDFVSFIFKYVADRKRKKFCLQSFKRDGETVRRGEKILEITGDVKLLLALERICLNLLSRLSGIATETKKMKDICSKYGVEVYATRKTTPGLRFLEKYAVVVGGGLPHRYDLKDAILIKDNHMNVLGGIKKLVDVMRNEKFKNLKKRIEIEIQNEEDLEDALHISEFIGDIAIMLDNVVPERLSAMIQRIRDFSRLKNIKVEIEVAGGIRLSNVLQYAALRPDRVSSGYLTLSPSVPDISADIERLG